MTLSFPEQFNDAIVITANQRLASFLHEQYTATLSEGSCLPSPFIVSFNQWLLNCYEACIVAGLCQKQLISHEQALILWERIIEDDPQRSPLLQVNATAMLCLDAWNLLHQWDLSLDVCSNAYDPDVAQFFLWARHFEAQLNKRKALTQHEFPALLASFFEAGHLLPSKRIVCVGFDEMAPNGVILFDALKSQGIRILTIPHLVEREHSVAQKVAFSHEQQELQQMVAWALDKASLGKGRYACIVPELQQNRHVIEEAFNDARSSLEHDVEINITGGKSFNQYAIIETTALLFNFSERFLANQLTSTDPLWDALLNTPFIAGGQLEQLPRAKLRLVAQHALSVDSVQLETTPLLDQCLKSLLMLKSDMTTCYLPSQWATRFIKLLQAFDWPGERRLSSTEYQLVERYYALLREQSAFDELLGEVTFKKMQQHVKQLTANRLFQAKSPTTSVQVMGLLEAIAYPFDEVWLLGITDSAWPPAAKPNPLLPKALQVAEGLPHSSASRELEFCQRVMKSLSQSCQRLIYSYSLEYQNQESQPSPLIKHLDTLDKSCLPMPDVPLAVKQFAQAPLEALVEHAGLPLPANRTTLGGTQIFKAQAACPFQAYARYRLDAIGKEEHVGHLDALDRGSLLHHALELFYKACSDLQALSPEKEKKQIKNAIDRACQQFAAQTDIASLYIDVEKKRLATLLTQWIDEEKKRPAFTIKAVEQRHQVCFEGIHLHVIIDRVDTLADGSSLLIDYKTGLVSPSSWFGPRPDEPQLPLYCLTCDLNVVGISFAQLRRDQLGYKGIINTQQQPLVPKPIAPLTQEDAWSWAWQKNQWQIELSELATGIKQGDARRDPKYSHQTCDYCDLHTLCRINQVCEAKS